MKPPQAEGATSETLVIASSFDNLETVVDAALTFFSTATDDMDVLHKVMLLTSEAVTNGMRHGNKMDEGKSVFIEFKSFDSSLEVWVEDEGQGFVRDEIPDPLSSEHLLDEGGRGIFLIEKMADEVRYELGGRRVGMTFLIPGPDSE